MLSSAKQLKEPRPRWELYSAGVMHGDVLERHALELAYKVRTYKTRMVSVHWCNNSGSHDYLSKLWGAITAHNPHRNMKTTAAKQGRQKETHR